MGDVVELPVITKLAIPVKRILTRAQKADLDLVIVIGVTKEGELYFCASEANGGDNLWWIEKAKKALLAIGDD